MEFFIKKNATLPILKMQVVKDGRSGYSQLMQDLEVSTIFFSMVDVETGIPKITSSQADIVPLILPEGSSPEYYIYFKFTESDTNQVGRFQGQFLIKNDEGNLILPIRENIYINIQESFISTEVCCEPIQLESLSEHGLGRNFIPDSRDNNYLIDDNFEGIFTAINRIKKVSPTPTKTSTVTPTSSLSITKTPTPTNTSTPTCTLSHSSPSSIIKKYWQDDIWWGNQGNLPQCVGYAWAHWIDDGPILHAGKHPIILPSTIYYEAQRIDEWPGENYAGTSVRAGAKYLQSRQKIVSYYWGFNLDTLIRTVSTLGPVVVGTNWYTGMFYPDNDGLIKISGNIAGGHAYVINGIDTEKKFFRIKNSWGRGWGLNGRAFISFDDMSRLISENGEICLAIENNF